MGPLRAFFPRDYLAPAEKTTTTTAILPMSARQRQIDRRSMLWWTDSGRYEPDLPRLVENGGEEGDGEDSAPAILQGEAVLGGSGG
jgi:hypothetical protein